MSLTFKYVQSTENFYFISFTLVFFVVLLEILSFLASLIIKFYIGSYEFNTEINYKTITVVFMQKKKINLN